MKKFEDIDVLLNEINSLRVKRGIKFEFLPRGPGVIGLYFGWCTFSTGLLPESKESIFYVFFWGY